MSQFNTVLVTGGAGYVGSVLVPKLLKNGYDVRVLDLYIYGDDILKPYRSDYSFQEIKGDIRDAGLLEKTLKDTDAVIHLACISNDPSAELDAELTKSINCDAFVPLLEISKKQGIRRFVYASSSSVYGISEDPNVTEDHPRVPVSEYNKSKAYCEDQLPRFYSDDFSIVTARPATICGYSPRLRLDLTVNILTNHAFHKGEITVFGGSQYRPNLHIDDMTDLYLQLLDEPDSRVSGKIFNAGYQNLTVMEIAKTVKNTIEKEFPEKGNIGIKTVPSDDIRSYRISTEKIKKELGFESKKTIEDAVRDLCQAFSRNEFPDTLTSNQYYNVKKMKEIKLK
ncbi:NAD-dependent epimerase/dehydratase family protein [Chloroflexota bacterium]